MRYHAHAPGGAAAAAPAGAAGGAAAGDWLPRALAAVRDAVVAAAPAVAGSTPYTGGAGVALALARAGRGEPRLLRAAREAADAAAARPGLRRRSPVALLDGQAGVFAVQALVTRWEGGAAAPGGPSAGGAGARRHPFVPPPTAGSAADPAAPLDGPLAHFASCCALAAGGGPADSDEVLYGRAGAGRWGREGCGADGARQARQWRAVDGCR
jgi:hypothetical protein